MWRGRRHKVHQYSHRRGVMASGCFLRLSRGMNAMPCGQTSLASSLRYSRLILEWMEAYRSLWLSEAQEQRPVSLQWLFLPQSLDLQSTVPGVFLSSCSPHIGVGNMFYEGVSMAACPSVCQDEQLNDQVIRNVEMWGSSGSSSAGSQSDQHLPRAWYPAHHRLKLNLAELFL